MKVMLFTFSERLSEESLKNCLSPPLRKQLFSEECVRIAFITDKTYNTIRVFMKIILNNRVKGGI